MRNTPPRPVAGAPLRGLGRAQAGPDHNGDSRLRDAASSEFLAVL